MQQIQTSLLPKLSERTNDSLELSTHVQVKVLIHNWTALQVQKAVYHYNQDWQF